MADFLNIATGARHGLRYVAEPSPGVTPVTPQTVDLRHTGCTLGMSRDSVSSNELRSDRQVSAVRTLADKIQGAVNFELSYGEYDTLLACALAGAWTDDVLKVGTMTPSVTLEREFADVGSYDVFTGCFCNRVSFDLKPNALVTGSFDLIGLAAASAVAPVCATPTPSQTHFPFDSFTGAILEGGTPLATVTGLSFSLENGLEAQYALMRRSASAMSWRKATCTGTLTAFFEGNSLVNKFLAETPSSLSLTLGSGTTASYEIVMPHIIYTGAEKPASDDGPIVLSMPFSAILDPATGTNLQITRIP